jgi:hypothetical protein
MAYTSVTSINEKTYDWTTNPDFVATAKTSSDTTLEQLTISDIEQKFAIVLGGNTLDLQEVFLTI